MLALSRSVEMLGAFEIENRIADQIADVVVSGITSRQGDLFPGKEPGPQFYPVSAIDYLTGYLMAFGAMVALAADLRRRAG